MYQNNKDFNLDAVDFGLEDSMRYDPEVAEELFKKEIKMETQYSEILNHIDWTVRISEIQEENQYGRKTKIVTFRRDSGVPGEDQIFYFMITAASFDITKEDIIRILAYVNSQLFAMEIVSLKKNWGPDYSFFRNDAFNEVKAIINREA